MKVFTQHCPSCPNTENKTPLSSAESRENDDRPGGSCLHDVVLALRQLPILFAECESLLAPGSGSGSGSGSVRQRVSGSRSCGISLNEEILDTRAAIRSLLAAWVHLVTDERAVTAPESREPKVMSKFLLAHLDWLKDHPAAAEFASEVVQVARSAEQLAHRPSPAPVDLGPCTRPDCGAPLLLIRDDTSRYRPDPASVRCAAGHTWLPHEWLRLSRRAHKSA